MTVFSMVFEFDDYVKTVIPAQAGIQANPNLSKTLDSRFHGNDGNGCFRTFYELVKFDKLVISPSNLAGTLFAKYKYHD